MKRFMSFILAAAFSFSAFAQLPRHEVTIDAFGGISQLNYKLEQNFAGNEVTMPMTTCPPVSISPN